MTVSIRRREGDGAGKGASPSKKDPRPDADASIPSRLLTRAHGAARFARENDRDVPASLAVRLSRTRDRTLNRVIAFHEAERDLRMDKLHQKTSGGLRSMQGVHDFANPHSVITSA